MKAWRECLWRVSCRSRLNLLKPLKSRLFSQEKAQTTRQLEESSYLWATDCWIDGLTERHGWIALIEFQKQSQKCNFMQIFACNNAHQKSFIRDDTNDGFSVLQQRLLICNLKTESSSKFQSWLKKFSHQTRLRRQNRNFSSVFIPFCYTPELPTLSLTSTASINPFSEP